MAKWISDEKGLLHPAKESAALHNRTNKPIKIEQIDENGKKFIMTVKPGAPYIYEGPDRAAMLQWWEENGKPTAEQIKAMPDGAITVGTNFQTNQEFMDFYAKYRQAFGFQNMSEFLTYLGYDAKKQNERFQKLSQEVNLHELPDRVPEIKKMGGGDDRANPGTNRRAGGWYEGALPSDEEMLKAGSQAVR
jgi:hypothetical protein